MRREELTKTLTISEAIKLGYEIRCGYSRKGLDTFSQFRGFRSRTGIIIGESKDKKCWWIRWDGVHYSTNYSKSFIEPIFDDEEKQKFEC